MSQSTLTHIALAVCLFVPQSITQAGDWPQAAGPNHDFYVDGDGPEFFSVASPQVDKSAIRWRSELPSTGQGTPIVVGDRVYVTSHESIEQDTETGSTVLGLCFDAETGEELWRRALPGTRVTDLSSLFSDNTAASPVATADRVCFVNVGGAISCFDPQGERQWQYQWVPFGRHHARLHEPILHGDSVITVQYPDQDLKPEHTTKPGAKPLGRDRKYWTHLQAFDLATGERRWISDVGTSIHQTSIMGTAPDRQMAILTGRGGGHQPPEEPYGMSLVSAQDGKEIWTQAISGYPSAQNACWNSERGFAFAGKEHLTLDIATGKVIARTSLVENVTITQHTPTGYKTTQGAKLTKFRRPITKNSNMLIGQYHYFRASESFMIGRVDVVSGNVEYLQVPVQVIREPGEKDSLRWDAALPNDMKTANGFVASSDRRNRGNGWGHVSAASPIAVGKLMYMPTMIGMVYVIRHDSPKLNEDALVSISDLGPATQTWSLSSLAFSNGRLYARTLKELICIEAAK